MNKRQYVIDLIAALTDTATAEMIVERLTDEGLLHLGYGDPDIDQIVAKFSDTFGTTKVSKTDRFAAGRLARKYGAQSVCGIITLLGDNAQENYAPVLNSVTELEQKWVSVVNFTAKQIRQDNSTISTD